MKKNIVLFISLWFTACSYKPMSIDVEKNKDLVSKSFTTVIKTYPMHPEVMTPGKAAGIALGGAMLGPLSVVGGTLIISATNRTHESFNMPQDYLYYHIIPILENKYKMKYTKNAANKEEEEKRDISTLMQTKEEPLELEKFKQKYTTDYILDINSKWNVGHFSMHWGTYVVRMQNDIRLIHRESKKSIAQYTCRKIPEYNEKLPSYDEMFANNAAILKKQTREILEECLDEIKNKMLQ